jgi:hypothetical protein
MVAVPELIIDVVRSAVAPGLEVSVDAMLR